MLYRWLFHRLYTRHAHVICRVSWYSRANPQPLSSVHSLFLEQTKCYFYLSECCHLFVVLYVKGLSCFFRLRSYFTKNTLSLKKTVSPAAALTLQRTVFSWSLHEPCHFHKHGNRGVTHHPHEGLAYMDKKANETSDYELWVVKYLEIGGRNVRESNITTFICKDIVKSLRIDHAAAKCQWCGSWGDRAFGSPSCNILSTRNETWQPAAPMRFKQSDRMYSGNTLMTVKIVGFQLRHRVVLQVEADILDECTASIFKPYPYKGTKGTTNQKPTT